MKKHDLSAVEPVEIGQDAAKATFTPSATFDAYPEGKKTRFIAGKESAPVPVDFIAMMRAKDMVAE